MEAVDQTPQPAHAEAEPETSWKRLDPRVIQLHRTVGWIVNAVVLFVYSMFAAMVTLAGLLRAGAGGVPWVAVVLWTIWPVLAGALGWLAHGFPELHYRHTTWRIDDVGLTIRTGVVWRKEISVARSRVQHIDVSQGPMERRYGLATLSVYTAGTQHSQVAFDGLEHGVALAARDSLLPASDVDAV